MHFSTIASAFVLGLMATAPVVADPAEFKRALAVRHVVCAPDATLLDSWTNLDYRVARPTLRTSTWTMLDRSPQSSCPATTRVRFSHYSTLPN